MATSMIARDVDVFCTSLDDHLKTVSELIVTFRFSYQWGQRKAFVHDDNITKSHRLNAICGSYLLNKEGSIDLGFVTLSK